MNRMMTQGPGEEQMKKTNEMFNAYEKED